MAVSRIGQSSRLEEELNQRLFVGVTTSSDTSPAAGKPARYREADALPDSTDRTRGTEASLEDERIKKSVALELGDFLPGNESLDRYSVGELRPWSEHGEAVREGHETSRRHPNHREMEAPDREKNKALLRLVDLVLTPKRGVPVEILLRTIRVHQLHRESPRRVKNELTDWMIAERPRRRTIGPASLEGNKLPNSLQLVY
jgi:hypothetical protein